MPRIRQSANVDLQGYTQVQSQPVTAAAVSSTLNAITRSPFMHAAMPLMASTSDSFTRQFYGQDSIPQQRILPAKGASGK